MRCSLTESGVRYWQYLPELFDWPADRNMKPCPLDGTYQLARNILAACVRPDGTVDANGGHALVIYDDRNPAFLPGGEAARQWEAATEPGAGANFSRVVRFLLDNFFEALRSGLGTLPGMPPLAVSQGAGCVSPAGRSNSPSGAAEGPLAGI